MAVRTLLVALLAWSAGALTLRQRLTRSALDAEAARFDGFLTHALSDLVDFVGELRNATHNATVVAAAASAPVNSSGASVLKLANASRTANASLKVAGNTTRRAVLNKQQQALKDLLSHLKSNIASFNKNEDEGKEVSERQLKSLKERLAKDQAQLNQTNISAWEHEMLVNKTRSEEREIAYWSRGRALEHTMFHANLKMTHGLMSKVKTVIEAYKEVLAKGKISPKMAQDIKRVSAHVPVALLEVQTAA